MRDTLVSSSPQSAAASLKNSPVKWITLGICIPLVIVLFVVIFLPKSWMFALYDRVRGGLGFSSSEHDAAKEERRREEEQRRRKEQDEANRTFIERHLNGLRAWKKPDLINCEPRPAPAKTEIALENLGLPPPVLHSDRNHRKDFRYAKNIAGFKQWLKDDQLETTRR